MRRLTLTEFRTEPAVPLSSQERDAIRRLYPGIRIEPSTGSDGRYDLTPDQRIGLVCLSSLVVDVRPKVPLSSVLFLLSYACDAAQWSDQEAEYGPDTDVVELLVIMLARMVQMVTRRGLLSGYRREEEGLQAPRGRILFDDHVRRRLGLSPPIDVRHDIFTTDVVENQLLLAALLTSGRIRLRSARAKREVARAQRLLGGVSRLHFAPAQVPDLVFTRLNRHYLPALALATLLLRSASLDLGVGGARASAFLIDMNTAFERFVRRALREALGEDAASFPDRPPHVWLDEQRRVPLRPDLCLMKGGRVVWIGDAKYKRLPAGAYKNADLYQLLAYSVATGLPGGALIYAADEGVRGAEHVVVTARKRLAVAALDLSATPAGILRQVSVVAEKVKREIGGSSGYWPTTPSPWTDRKFA